MSQTYTPPRRGSEDGSMGKVLLCKCEDLSSGPQNLQQAGHAGDMLVRVIPALLLSDRRRRESLEM